MNSRRSEIKIAKAQNQERLIRKVKRDPYEKILILSEIKMKTGSKRGGFSYELQKKRDQNVEGSKSGKTKKQIEEGSI